MTQPRIRTRKNLRQAFVATVTAASAVAAVACGNFTTTNPPFAECPASAPAHGEACNAEEAGLSCGYGEDFCGWDVTYTCEDGSWLSNGEGSCNPPPPEECPIERPAYGDACFEIGMSCFYPDPFCGFESEAVCGATGWEIFDGSCNPPPAECPVEMPTVGAACEEQPDSIDGYPSYCVYDVNTPCGVEAITVGCEWDELEEQTTWTVQVAPTCQAQPDGCQDYDQSSACSADPACAWRVPGCDVIGTSPQIEAGCYPSDDCTVTGCGDWGTCTAVTIDPCYGSNCNVCAGEANVCVPN